MENSNVQTKEQTAVSPLKKFNNVLSNERTQEYLKTVLASRKESFVNNITALVANDAKLQQCNPMSLIYAGIKATALDLPLDPNLGFAWVIPYNNRKEGTTEAQFQIGYKGFIQLAIRSGQFSRINVTDVREGELKEFNLLTGDINIVAVPNREKLPIIGYAAFFLLTQGFAKTLYMTKEEIELHAKRYSQTYSNQYESTRKNSKWSTDFDAMAKKTTLKLLLNRYAPLSVQMQDAIRADQGVINEEGQPEYVDNNIQEAEEVPAYNDLVEEKKEELRNRQNTAPVMP